MTASRAYLAFRAGGSRYAIPAELVREVSRPRRVVPLPGAPKAYAGVGLLRGEPLGLLDVARAMRRGALGSAPLAVALEGRAAALLVDRVDGVVHLEEAAIRPGPHGSPEGEAEAQLGGETVHLFSPDRLLRATDEPSEEDKGLPPIEDPA